MVVILFCENNKKNCCSCLGVADVLGLVSLHLLFGKYIYPKLLFDAPHPCLELTCKRHYEVDDQISFTHIFLHIEGHKDESSIQLLIIWTLFGPGKS